MWGSGELRTALDGIPVNPAARSAVAAQEQDGDDPAAPARTLRPPPVHQSASDSVDPEAAACERTPEAGERAAS